jgi:tetratricopeptide (TPR) repeat protein
MGDVYQQLGNSEMALKFYQDKLEIDQKLVELDASNVKFQRDLSISYSKLAMSTLSLGNTQVALDAYQNPLRFAKP